MLFAHRIHRLSVVTFLGGLSCCIAGSFWPRAASGELLPGGAFDDDHFSLVYDAKTGELALDYVTPPLSAGLSVINITSEAGIFTGTVETGFPLGLGAFGEHTDWQIFFFRDGSGKDKPFSFGHVAIPGLGEDFVLQDLSAVGVFQSATDIGPVDLIYLPVPEPSTAVLFVFGLSGIVGFLRTANRSVRMSAA